MITVPRQAMRIYDIENNKYLYMKKIENVYSKALEIVLNKTRLVLVYIMVRQM